jgi:hypothetical protein
VRASHYFYAWNAAIYITTCCRELGSVDLFDPATSIATSHAASEKLVHKFGDILSEAVSVKIMVDYL